MPKKIGVFGAGSWGTTLAILLADKGYDVTLWAYEDKTIKNILLKGENVDFLPGVNIPEGLVATNSLQIATEGKNIIVSVIPSSFVRETTLQYRDYLSPNVHLVSATKGVEEDSLLRMSEVIQQVIPSDLKIKLSCISGPSFAREVAQQMATALTVACEDPEEATYIQHLFSTSYFRVYRTSDIMGVELAGSLKNIIAIAAGISDGLGFGNNARSALITRGLVEIVRLGIAMGAKVDTFYGMSGVGDLILTCTGDLSRNRTLGKRICGGEKLDDILAGMKMVAEGVVATMCALDLAKKFNVEMPITEQVSAILFQGKDPQDVFDDLMGRVLREE